jgi:endonuclease/exonuclease/phosphatase family metal-dependent hydrolase
MSFNLRYKDDEEGSVINRSQISTAIISRYSPDSFGVQEATLKWLRILDKAVGDKYARVGEPRDKKGPFSEYSAVFYLKDKYNLLDSGTIWLSETPEKKYTGSFGTVCLRIATWAVLEDKETGVTYTHINTHLDHVLESTRVGQIKVLMNKVREINEEGNFVCTGDFNTYNNGEVYAEMIKVAEDTRLAAHLSDDGHTFHGYGKIEKDELGAIDYIFVSKDTEVDTYKIIRDTAKGMYPSDHYPIIADVKFEK